MPWVYFERDLDWRPSHNVIFAYKQGMSAFVTRRCARFVQSNGYGNLCERPAEEPRGAEARFGVVRTSLLPRRARSGPSVKL